MTAFTILVGLSIIFTVLSIWPGVAYMLQLAVLLLGIALLVGR